MFKRNAPEMLNIFRWELDHRYALFTPNRQRKQPPIYSHPYAVRCDEREIGQSNTMGHYASPEWNICAGRAYGFFSSDPGIMYDLLKFLGLAGNPFATFHTQREIGPFSTALQRSLIQVPKQFTFQEKRSYGVMTMFQ
jgi:hypothetical protein